ncbi:hypothetical protein AGMMS4952_03200 [Spirochaetia bacterium]|nr:hypothetical protein AGMMS4952_03200 [Spirochaetia bacterium]
MKKYGLLVLLCGVFAFPLPAQEVLTVDAALTKASLQILMPAKAKVLVLSYETPAKTFSDYIGEVLTYDLEVKMKRNVITYRNVDTIHADYRIRDPAISDKKAVEIGKALGVNVVILAAVKKLGSDYQMKFVPLTVRTGKAGTSLTYKLKEDNVLTELLSGPAVTEMEAAGAPVEGAVRRLRAMRDASN